MCALASAVECEMICQGSCTLDMRRLGIEGWELVIDDLGEKREGKAAVKVVALSGSFFGRKMRQSQWSGLRNA